MTVPATIDQQPLLVDERSDVLTAIIFRPWFWMQQPRRKIENFSVNEPVMPPGGRLFAACVVPFGSFLDTERFGRREYAVVHK